MRLSPGFLVPRSLRARLILLILGSVLLTQAATLVTVSYFRHKFMEDVAIGYITTTTVSYTHLTLPTNREV